MDIIYANNNNNIDKIKYLLKKDINFNFFPENLLILACHKNNLEIIDLLLKNQRIIIKSIYKYNITILHSACFKSEFDVVKILIYDAKHTCFL